MCIGIGSVRLVGGKVEHSQKATKSCKMENKQSFRCSGCSNLYSKKSSRDRHQNRSTSKCDCEEVERNSEEDSSQASGCVGANRSLTCGDCDFCTHYFSCT